MSAPARPRVGAGAALPSTLRKAETMAATAVPGRATVEPIEVDVLPPKARIGGRVEQLGRRQCDGRRLFLCH